jgi:hypothetical protein
LSPVRVRVNEAKDQLHIFLTPEVLARVATTVSGYIYNQRAGYRADHMQLSIERLDAAGTVIGTSTTWVLGGVPLGSRAFFSTRVEPAASYRVHVLSFEWNIPGGTS